MATYIFNHALIEHKLTLMRDQQASTLVFKQNLDDIAKLMAYEITRDLPLKDKDIITPLCPMTGKELANDIVLVPILRAGLGVLDGFRDIIKEAKDGIKALTEELNPKEEAGAAGETASASQEAIPEGTVIGDGKLKINLARIDTRLLHGQVATGWTPASKADRIIVASDTVAKDELRKGLIKQAAPAGVRANVVPIDKLIAVSKDPRFGNTHALILFETPQDALRAIEGGVPIKELNVGSMAHSTGKTMVNNVLSMDKADVETFEKLRDLGVSFDVRKVPNDSPKNLFDLIKKANVQ